MQVFHRFENEKSNFVFLAHLNNLFGIRHFLKAIVTLKLRKPTIYELNFSHLLENIAGST
ncbi:hypothetical protein MHTCC0001_20520 [Flavobacteriaceae bacterium MHTCC 0001]